MENSDEKRGMELEGDGKVDGRPKFHVDMDLIPSTHLTDEIDDLKGLDIEVFNQEDFEEGNIKNIF